MTLEQILKAQGYTDADIAAQATMLNDPKLRGALEAAWGATHSKVAELEADLGRYRSENDKWSEWLEEHGKPTLALYEKDSIEAKAALAAAHAKLKAAEEAGFLPAGSAGAPPAQQQQQQQQPEFDPKKYKLVTHDDIGNYAKLQGDAIVMANDVEAEYRYLYPGKSLFEYNYTDKDGRTLRGLTAIRAEAMAAGKRIDEFAAQKFDFAGKRAAMAAEAQQKHDDAMRAEGEARAMQKYGEPGQRPLMPSAEPFMPGPREVGGERKQPWDIPAQDRRTTRLSQLMQTQVKSLTQ